MFNSTNRRLFLGAVASALVLFAVNVWWKSLTLYVLLVELLLVGFLMLIFAQRQPDSRPSTKLSWTGLLQWAGLGLIGIGIAGAIRFLQNRPYDWQQALSVFVGFLLAFIIITPIRNALLKR